MSSPPKPGHGRSHSRSTRTVTNEVGRLGDPKLAGSPLIEEGELLAGRFSIFQEIGKGGAGTVFSAFDTKVGQKVAVKVLHADIREASQLERLRREVRASRPGHPHAVAVYDLFDDGRRRFLTMELIDKAIAMLGEWSKDEFREFQNFQLVRAIRTVALLESGDRDLARREALRLSGELDPTLLPGTLVAEVLAETEG